MNTKRFFTVILAVMLCAAILAGCGTTPAAPDTDTGEKLDIRVGALKGPTGLGMLKLMEDSEAGNTANNYKFSIAGAPEEISAKIINGELDIAAVPSNMAAVLWNRTEGAVKVLNVNTLGMLYIVENGEPTIKSVEDLKGKTIYSTGQAATPEYVLNYILKENGIDPANDVTIEYKTEHSELAALVASGEADIALLPEPFVSSVLKQNENISVSLNLTDEWEKVAGKDNKLAMGAVIARTGFLEENKDAVDAFLAEYKTSAEYTNASVDDAAALSEKFDIMPAAVAKVAIPKCNIVYIDGKEMKTSLKGFYDVLFNFNNASIGGSLPSDEFYYSK